uniref:DNA-3-methyladenine glycosylase I n=1 Tax=Arundo donax TaxID=35708 RepID=A0A0A9DFM8_ARUDO
MSGAGARGRLSPASGGGDSEPRSAGSRTRSVSAARGRKPSPRPGRDVGAAVAAAEEEKKPAAVPTLLPSLSAPAGMRRQELLLRSGLSLDASCSSDASTDSFCSRASTGRIGRPVFGARKKKTVSQTDYKSVSMLDRESGLASPTDAAGVKRCAWVTANTDPCYAAFHDEEWGVPVHDDKKLFELLVLSGALAELTWPTILSKRPIFRKVFMDFDPVLVSKLSEKKIIAPGSPSSSLLSEQKLRGVIENARQILKIVEEFGSFAKYCWSFVNHKPILSRFRYPRQVPVKTSKADAISKDLVRRGFRSVGPTVVYTFMQVSGMTNDHLISCYRFTECAAATTGVKPTSESEANPSGSDHVTEQKMNGTNGLAADIELSRSIDELSIS